MKGDTGNGYARIGVVTGAIVVLLFVAPALAEETTTILLGDGSALTIYGEFQHVTPGGPGTDSEPSTGALTPIGPFTGDESEGFDYQQIGDPFPTCVEDRVFHDNADLCSTGGCAHITPSWGFSCVIFPHDTPRLYGSCDGYSIYTFDSPVQAFGGYFGSNAAGPPNGVARFYDADNVLIDTVDLPIAPNCQWTWGGWEAADAIIAKVEVESDVFGGAFIMMDDMEINFGDPTPVETTTWGQIKVVY
jgi:hypothetical protein